MWRLICCPGQSNGGQMAVRWWSEGGQMAVRWLLSFDSPERSHRCHSALFASFSHQIHLETQSGQALPLPHPTPRAAELLEVILVVGGDSL